MNKMIVNIFGLDLDRYPSYFDPRASLKSDALALHIMIMVIIYITNVI